MIKYSLVIPCYNEYDSLPVLCSQIEKFLTTVSDAEVILVDNGSNDNTQDYLLNHKIIVHEHFSVVSLQENQGYGGGILSGLTKASGDWVGWTHADLQTDILDVVNVCELLNNLNDEIFVKGRRTGRALSDTAFTFLMSVFESILFRTILHDINAQPTFMSKNLFNSWDDPPSDFSLDLYAYISAKSRRTRIVRIKTVFAKRLYGSSSWNTSIMNKIKFIVRTVRYSFKLRSNRNW